MCRLLATLVLCVGLHSPSHADNAGLALATAGADTATAVALSAGLVALNPLGPLGALLVKAVTMGYINALPEAEQARQYSLVSSFWGGAAAQSVLAHRCRPDLLFAWCGNRWLDLEHRRKRTPNGTGS